MLYFVIARNEAIVNESNKHEQANEIASFLAMTTLNWFII